MDDVRYPVGGMLTEPRPAVTGTPRASPEGEIALGEAAAILLRRWRVALAFPIGGAVIALVIATIASPRYTATAAFLPEARSGSRLPGVLAGFASQFGLAVMSDAAQSPRFYAAVLKSRPLLERVVLLQNSQPVDAQATPSVTLLEALRVTDHDSAGRVDGGVKELQRVVRIHVDNQTNIVRVGVELRDPVLAAQVANRLVASLGEFNAKTRQLQARERRRFVEARIGEAELELRETEEQLRRFYERNRTWEQSPQLRFEEGRLRRGVDLQQEVYLTLKREHEIARIEEVNDSPTITVIEPAVVPTDPSRPRRPLMVAVAFLLGGLLGVGAAFVTEHASRLRQREQQQDRQLHRLVSRAQNRLAQGVRALLRLHHSP